MLELPCPHCGMTVRRRWWRCMPSSGIFPDVTCETCGKDAHFPPQFKILGWLLGTCAALAVFFWGAHLVEAVPADRVFAALAVVPAGLSLWLIASLCCAFSNELVIRHART